MGNDGVRRVAEESLHEPHAHEREHRGEEGVGREREGKPRLPDAAQVDEDDDAEAREREQDLVARE